MKDIIQVNPFVVGRYVSDRYFCDRKDETAQLLKHIWNGRNVALISPRRMGKTGLIHHCFGQDRLASYHTFFVDIYATTSLAELVYLLGKAIYDELKPRSSTWVDRFFRTVGSLRMGFKFDPVTGDPVLDISLGDIQAPQTTLDEIFRYLETADRPCVVAIDEFQQIGNYVENNVEAMLRTRIQQCHNTFFIFAGSRRHLMSNMFNSAAKPFYQSAVTMGLGPIPSGVYADFASKMFEDHGRRIQDGVAQTVHERFDGCTWFVQMIMNELFALTPHGGVCGKDMVDTAIRNVIIAQEGTYKELLTHIAPKQKQVLQAIAREGMARSITSGAFVKKYKLTSASSVQAAVKSLLKTELVTQDGDAYRVYDHFLAYWLAHEY